jgi:hypothetical protein
MQIDRAARVAGDIYGWPWFNYRSHSFALLVLGLATYDHSLALGQATLDLRSLRSAQADLDLPFVHMVLTIEDVDKVLVALEQ